MKQQSLGLTGFERKLKKTRKQQFLEEMEQVVPWSALEALIEPYSPKAGRQGGRPGYAIGTLLRIHFMQQWFGLSDPAMEEALHDVPLYRAFVGLDLCIDNLPDESTILRFRHLLQTHDLAPRILQTVNTILSEKGLMLKSGTVIDATLISAPSSTKNQQGQRDPEMHSTKKGEQWYFGMKAHIGVDAESGLVHSVIGTAANVHDVTQAHALVRGTELDVFTDAGYQGVAQREETHALKIRWHVAMRPGKRRALKKIRESDGLLDKLEKLKACIRAKVEHPFRVIKRQFGYTKVRYKGLAKNTAQIITLFALSNLWMTRKKSLSA